MKISIVISAYNEEKKLASVLKSVAWANEIILIDNESTDSTKKIAKDYGAKVYSQKNKSMLNVNKNYGFQKSSNEWILNLDADEIVTPELKEEIESVISNQSAFDGYWIPRKNIIFGKWIKHGIWWPDKQLRLFRKNKGSFPCIHVHEYLEVKGDKGELKNSFVHYNYETISQYVKKLDSIYTENEVNNLIDKKIKFSWRNLIKNPFNDFIKIFLKEQGYKDGVHGLVLAMLQMFYTFVVYAKLWEKSGFSDTNINLKEFSEETKLNIKVLKYWFKTVIINDEKNIVIKFLLKLQRKFL